MPLERPTLAELITRSESELAARLGLATLLERSVLKVLARTWAGGLHGLYGYLDWITAQVTPLNSEAEILERWADLYGLARRAATAATGSVTFTGTTGTAVSTGAIVQRADGQRYRVTAGGSLVAGAATLAVESELAGLDGNAAAGTTLILAAPIAGITAVTVAAGGITGGLDEETDDELRDRLRDFVSDRPQGGSHADYEAWAREVAGVTRVFVLEHGLGLGTVLVYFAVDNDPAGPFPSAGQVASVQDRIDDETRRDSRPVTAQVTVSAPTPLPVSVTLSVTPNTQAVQDAVRDSLEAMLRREGFPGRNISRSKFEEAISTANGEQDHTLAVPAGDLTVASGELPVLDSVTFT